MEWLDSFVYGKREFVYLSNPFDHALSSQANCTRPYIFFWISKFMSIMCTTLVINNICVNYIHVIFFYIFVKHDCVCCTWCMTMRARCNGKQFY